MLEFFRERIQGTFATVIVVFFCAVFALWGVEALFHGSKKPDAVATVNDRDITEAELANAIEMLRAQYTKMLGGQVDAKFLNDKMLREPALESLISRTLLEEYVTENKILVGKGTVDKEIVADKNFSRDGKTFDADFYKDRLRQSGLTAAAYQKYLGKQLQLQYLQKGIADTAFVTDAEIAVIARLMAQKRSFEYVVFPLQKYVDAAVVTDASLEKYYQEHQADFMTDEQVAIEYLELTKKNIADSIEIVEADVRQAYEKEMQNFKPGTERSAAHILIEAKEDGSHEKTLLEIQDRLKKGESFADLAKTFSVDEGSAAQGGDVGFTTGETFVPEFESALAGLANVGDVSAPVKTEFGYHIIKLTGKRDTVAKSFDERKAEIEKELRGSKASTAYNEKIDALNESTYSAGDLSGPAQELGLTVQSTVPFGRRGGVGIAGEQKIIEAAFSADLIESGKNSQVIELAGDRALVIRVKEHLMPKARELTEVKTVVVDKVKRGQAEAQLKEKIATLKARADSEKALDAIAKEEGLRVETVVLSKRKEGKPEQADVYEKAFSMARPASGVAVMDSTNVGAGDWVLIKLNAVEDAEVTPESPEFVEVKSRMSQSAGNDDFAVFERELQAKAKITRRGAEPTPEK